VSLKDVPVPSTESPKKRGPGRPKKSEIIAKKKRGVVGRPAGDQARIAELKARLLATTGDRVINKIVEIAMSDGHPVQGAALKMCIDRVLPLSLFEKDAKGQRGAVTINITGLTEAKPVEVIDSVEVEVQDVEYEDESRD
jgi:hypothetical protein